MIILKGDYIEDINNTYDKSLIINNFSHNYDHFQKHAFKAITNDSNVLITAHTGSGKTIVGIYAILTAIKNNKRAIYTSPIKSLSNEKYKEFTDKFKDNPNISVGILTGDNKINVDGNVLIMTAEILRNTILKSYNDDAEAKKFVDSIGCIIMDEVHYINDTDRGAVWEETIVLANKNIQLVMLSATVDKPEKFANWIGKIRPEKEIYLIPTEKRAVPLNHFLFLNNDIYNILDSQNNYNVENYNKVKNIFHKNYIEKKNKLNNNIINDLVKFLWDNELTQTIFFCFSRKKTELLSNIININLIDKLEVIQINNIWKKYLYNVENKYIHLEQYNLLKNLVVKGIAFHHSGLVPILKEIVEILFQKGLIKILFATETFAVGVNMPTRSVVFTDLQKYTNNSDNYRFLNTAEYKQMAGRAGRRGIDKIGYSIILPFDSKYNLYSDIELRNVLTGKIPEINSKFNINYDNILKINITNNSNFLNNTLKFNEKSDEITLLNNNISDINIKINNFQIDENNISNILINYYTLDKKIKTLISNNIKPDKKLSKDHNELYKNIQKDKSLYDLFKKMTQKNNLNHEFTKLNHDLDYLINEDNININNLKNILFESNFITINNNSYVLTEKGIIASRINECNSLLLTDMIFNNMFNNLNGQEIVALISIFTESNNSYNSLDYAISNNLDNNFKSIDNLINYYINLENKYNYTSKDDYWNISYQYTDAAFLWADGKTTISMLKEFELIEYEGNFIRSIIKIYNIINDLIDIFKKLNKNDIVIILEKIPELLIRDVIDLNSLYFLK